MRRNRHKSNSVFPHPRHFPCKLNFLRSNISVQNSSPVKTCRAQCRAGSAGHPNPLSLPMPSGVGLERGGEGVPLLTLRGGSGLHTSRLAVPPTGSHYREHPHLEGAPSRGASRRGPSGKSEAPSPVEGARAPASSYIRIPHNTPQPTVTCDCPQIVVNKRGYGGRHIAIAHVPNCLTTQHWFFGASYDHTIIPLPPSPTVANDMGVLYTHRAATLANGDRKHSRRSIVFDVIPQNISLFRLLNMRFRTLGSKSPSDSITDQNYFIKCLPISVIERETLNREAHQNRTFLSKGSGAASPRVDAGEPRALRGDRRVPKPRGHQTENGHNTKKRGFRNHETYEMRADRRREKRAISRRNKRIQKQASLPPPVKPGRGFSGVHVLSQDKPTTPVNVENTTMKENKTDKTSKYQNEKPSVFHSRSRPQLEVCQYVRSYVRAPWRVRISNTPQISWRTL